MENSLSHFACKKIGPYWLDIFFFGHFQTERKKLLIKKEGSYRILVYSEFDFLKEKYKD